MKLVNFLVGLVIFSAFVVLMMGFAIPIYSAYDNTRTGPNASVQLVEFQSDFDFVDDLALANSSVVRQERDALEADQVSEDFESDIFAGMMKAITFIPSSFVTTIKMLNTVAKNFGMPRIMIQAIWSILIIFFITILIIMFARVKPET